MSVCSQATEDLQMAESAFENVNRKFERLSTVIMDLKHNEDAMKVKVRESEERLVRSSAKYEALRFVCLIFKIVRCQVFSLLWVFLVIFIYQVCAEGSHNSPIYNECQTQWA